MAQRQVSIIAVALVLLGVVFFVGRVPSAPPTPAAQTVAPSGGLGEVGATLPALHAGTPAVALGDSVAVARVIDGDTIEIAVGDPSAGAQGRDRVRYIGIDTPETVDPRKPVQCFGVEASVRNKEFVEGTVVRLVRDVSDRDRYGRLLRYVWVGDTFVNLELVREGYAHASAFPPDVAHADEFQQAEAEARAAGRGLWSACASGTASVAPATAASPTSEPSAPSGTCIIKGNIGSAGVKIYHLPGCPYYAATKIDEARGERWFCSEADAVAAGWRRAANCP